MIFPLTDYQEDGKRRWAFCQRQRWPGEKGQEEAVVSTLQNQGWMHDGISNDGLLYKTIAVLGLVHGKIYQLLCKLVPKNNQFRLANCPPKHNKIHSSTSESFQSWLALRGCTTRRWDANLLSCSDSFHFRIRRSHYREYSSLQWPSKVPMRSGPNFSILWLQISLNG